VLRSPRLLRSPWLPRITITATALFTLAACRSGSTATAPTTTTTTSTAATAATPALPPGCTPTPPATAPLAWLPADLPLPTGTFTVQELLAGPQSYQALFAVPTDLVGFVKFVNAEWPKHGWAQGRGEAEPGEAENNFSRSSTTTPGTSEGGAWRVRQPYCDQGLAEVLMVFKK
jgi:hypothetical protein